MRSTKANSRHAINSGGTFPHVADRWRSAYQSNDRTAPRGSWNDNPPDHTLTTLTKPKRRRIKQSTLGAHSRRFRRVGFASPGPTRASRRKTTDGMAPRLPQPLPHHKSHARQIINICHRMRSSSCSTTQRQYLFTTDIQCNGNISAAYGTRLV